MKYVVMFNSHRYSDCSDTPRAEHRIIEAMDTDNAMDILRAREKVGARYIGMVHVACLKSEAWQYGIKVKA